MYRALGIATAVYVGVSLGVFGTLTAEQVVEYGATALAEAAKPVLGEAGYVLMVITALFSTAGAVNASLYPAAGMTRHLAEVGQFPTAFGRKVGRRAPVGLVVIALITIFMVVALDLNSIASLGSAVALLIFSAVTVSHFKTHKETGANLFVLVVALIATLGTFVVFTMTTLVNEPRTALALVVILAGSVLLDLIWKRIRDRGKARYARHADEPTE
jgi:amino acid transporter